MNIYLIVLVSLLAVALVAGLAFSIQAQIQDKYRVRRTDPLRVRPLTSGRVSLDSHRPFTGMSAADSGLGRSTLPVVGDLQR